GWAAGIERLAMLLADDVIDTRLDAVIAVEDDGQLAFAMRALAALRNGGFATEIVASGSPRKRFDKAAKIPAHALISIGSRDGALHLNVRGDGDRAKAVEGLVRAL
ncbi:MAG TPA: histidine--tRNA ligase, partial [Sphingopyxis sp.]|nr:histidine--tRNA ligase [Sphingopyxis sp.]